MPPRKSRRLLKASSSPEPEEITAEETNVASPFRPDDEPDLKAGAGLLRLPPELFDAIIENFDTTLLDEFYYYSGPPDQNCYERTDVLTALSQTCRYVRNFTLHRLWERLDICRVPERARASWFKYAMVALERKANGIAESPVRHYVRTLTLMFSNSKPDAAVEAFQNMIINLLNLRAIHVIHCTIPGFSNGDWDLELPNVTRLFIPDGASVFQRICPNAAHIRCVGGIGERVLSALTDATEIFDGKVSWMELKPEFVDRIVANAPNLRTIEIRPHWHDYSFGGGFVQWTQTISRLAPLKKLSTLILSFPTVEEKPGDAVSILAARLLFRGSTVVGEKRLVIRRFLISQATGGQVLHSSTIETFN
ncbi:hypothetical protein FB451DRAFT_1224059 [Mycena latifolia]|nr:hypothetical protein FB451DRAFT_1224059 [Mycena latifolia]